jgi:hypothetical protein
MNRQLILELDEADWDTIHGYIAEFQRDSQRVAPKQPTIVAEGDSNLAGAIMAECVRDLLEYRDIMKAKRDEL